MDITIKKRGRKYTKVQTPILKYHNEKRKIYYNFKKSKISMDEFIILRKELQLQKIIEELHILRETTN